MIDQLKSAMRLMSSVKWLPFFKKKKKVKILPPDIIIEILSRLPVKSILRFRCVSIFFYTVTQEHYFIKKHRSHNRYRSIPTPFTLDEDELSHVIVLEEQKFRYHDHAKGVMLLEADVTNQFCLWNPATEEMLNLPPPSEPPRGIFRTISMWFPPAINGFKLIHFYKCHNNEAAGKTCGLGCEVLTVGADPAWRRALEISNCLDDVRNEKEIFDQRKISKVLYILRVFKIDGVVVGDDDDCYQLICIEMGNERATRINIPRHFFPDWRRCNIMLVKWNKEASLVGIVEDDLHIWILKNFKQEKWAKEKIVISLTFLNKYPTMTATACSFKAKGNELWVQNLRGEKLTYEIQSQKQKVNYYTFNTTRSSASPLPSGRIMYAVTPSLAPLKRMQLAAVGM